MALDGLIIVAINFGDCMSRMIDRLITELVNDSMIQLKKLKKAEVIDVTKDLLTDNLRELTDDTIIKIYEERYNTNLSGV